MANAAEEKVVRSTEGTAEREQRPPLITSTDLVGGDGSFRTIAFLARVLSDVNRLRILRCVSNGKKSVSRIAEELNLSQPLVSHHLKELKRSLLVTVERSGPFVYHELGNQRILDVIQALHTVATELPGRET